MGDGGGGGRDCGGTGRLRGEGGETGAGKGGGETGLMAGQDAVWEGKTGPGRDLAGGGLGETGMGRDPRTGRSGRLAGQTLKSGGRRRSRVMGGDLRPAIVHEEIERGGGDREEKTARGVGVGRWSVVEEIKGEFCRL